MGRGNPDHPFEVLDSPWPFAARVGSESEVRESEQKRKDITDQQVGRMEMGTPPSDDALTDA